MGPGRILACHLVRICFVPPSLLVRFQSNVVRSQPNKERTRSEGGTKEYRTKSEGLVLTSSMSQKSDKNKGLLFLHWVSLLMQVTLHGKYPPFCHSERWPRYAFRIEEFSGAFAKNLFGVTSFRTLKLYGNSI